MPPRWRNGKSRRGDSAMNHKIGYVIEFFIGYYDTISRRHIHRFGENPTRAANIHPPPSFSPGCRCSYLAPCPGLPSPTGLRPVYGTICFVPARYSGKHQTMLLCAQGMPTYGADAMNRIPTIKYSSVCV